MNTGGWIMMTLSVGSVLALITFCVARVLALPPMEEDHLKAPLDIDTGDKADPD
jgi:uncharacterized membrane protein